MSDAQKLMADAVARLAYTHRVRPGQCSCGERLPAPSDSSHAHHLGQLAAAEIDKSLGGLRKLNGHGQLLPGGILQSVYAIPGAPAPESKTYTQWTSGWTEVQS
ncbi:hypothetical protein BA059_16755 [Mycolicibacterium sp. (ex Dasyatis americana)]|nr:hypothetical protein BA059_16755 [Mycolicibacterium sp. (ex Dasyatis americana)]